MGPTTPRNPSLHCHPWFSRVMWGFSWCRLKAHSNLKFVSSSHTILVRIPLPSLSSFRFHEIVNTDPSHLPITQVSSEICIFKSYTMHQVTQRSAFNTKFVTSCVSLSVGFECLSDLQRILWRCYSNWSTTRRVVDTPFLIKFVT